MKKFHTDWEDFKADKLCNAWVATAIVGSAAIGAGASIFGSTQAASAQRDATATAARLATEQRDQTRSDLAPYRGIGQLGTDELTRRLPELTAPIVMDQATLEATPGYQFNRTQGLKAVQNSAAARGLGVSGAALKGAATFATGLADSTYQNQFNNAQQNQKNAFDRLKSLVDTGENAGAQTGVIGTANTGTAASATVAGGNASAAMWNGIGTAVNNGANNIGGYLAYRGLYGGSGGANTSVPNNGTGIYTGDPTIPGFA